MKIPSTLAILMATIVSMEHRERIVLKCNSFTDAEFQEPVSLEIYSTVQHERIDRRKNLRISYVDSVGKPVPSSKVYNKFAENLEDAFVIENIFNKVSEELLEVPKKEIEVIEEVEETPIFETPVFVATEETPAEILSAVATEEPKEVEKPKAKKTSKDKAEVVTEVKETKKGKVVKSPIAE
jgi:hypothetical protein